ncbi:MAG: hypothetical protein JWQ98_2375 [Chlorobi bacterium]|nr:hypothetical protein [Chlorobiota bacterium]
MRPLRLNIAALRAERPLRLRRSGGLLDDVAANAEGLRLSRRQLLGLSVSAGAALSIRTPAAKAVAPTMLGEFDITGDRKRVAFRLGGKERWVIDTARFGGSPSIAVEREGGHIRVEMSGALYPGTHLPADFSCEIHPGLLGRKMKLDLALGGFSATLPLERWLAGAVPARSAIRTDLHLCEFRPGSGISLHGPASAEFFPDWTLRLAGSDVARLNGQGRDVRSDAASISLADPKSESLLDRRMPLRSLIVMERRDKIWEMEHATAAGDPWRVLFDGAAFDLLHVETGEGRNGARASALMAEGNGDAAGVMVRPHGSLIGGNGDHFSLPLRRPRYALMFDGDEERSALVARYSADPVWLHTSNGSVLVGDDGSGARFEIEHAGSTAQRVDCAPALLSTYGPPMGEGVISQPVAADPGRRMTFLTRGMEPAVRDATDYVHFHPGDGDGPAKMVVGNMRVSMIRPQDLLVLEFEFINLSLSTGIGGLEKGRPDGSPTERIGRVSSHLARGSGAAYIVAHFQPQNVAEEAFFEVDDTAHIPVKIPPNKGGTVHTPPDPDAVTGEETPKRPPVQSRFAGKSRLVFKVPAGTTSIPYSLEAILAKLGEYDMSVVPAALPPKTINWGLVAVDTGLIKIDVSTIFQLNAEPGKGVYKSGTLGGVNIPHSPAITTKSLTIKPGGLKRLQGDATVAEKYIYEKHTQQLTQNSGLSKYVVDEKEINARLAGLYVVATRPDLKNPAPNETAIESPYRLIISPHVLSAWAHSAKPVVSPMTGRSELWHTRLAVRGAKGAVDETDATSALRTIRAVWARPWVGGVTTSGLDTTGAFDPADPQHWPLHANVPFRMSLDGFDRHNIVHLSANFHLHILRDDYEPTPIKVERLMLTSLGAWMDTRGAWDKLPLGLSVEEWRHRGTMGRDNYVRVVYAGFLFPFGHRASLIKVTERKFQPHPDNSSVKVAYLRQRMFIVVREPEKLFGGSGVKENGESFDLQMPFKRVQITTLVTPNLDPPENSDFPDAMLQSSFWPRVGNKDFQFHLVLEDLNGQTSEITMPLQFIGKEMTDQDSNVTMLKIARQFNGDPGAVLPAYPVERRERPFNGQKVAFAASKKLGDTVYEVDTITFNARVPSDPTVYSNLSYMAPRFYPVVRKSKLLIPAIKHLVGNDGKGNVEYHTEYLKSGFDGANVGEVFLKMVSGGIDLSFDKKGDRSGGLVKPNMSISGLSRKLGPVAGSVDNMTVGNFDPADFFAGLNAKLFGCIDLFSIIQSLGADKLDLMPKFVTEALNTVEAFMKDVEAFKGTLEALPGALSSAANTLKGDIDGIIGHITSFNPGALPGDLTTFVGHLQSMATNIPKTPGIDAALKNEALARLAQFKNTLADVADFVQKIKSFADAIEMAKEMKVKFEWRPLIKEWGFVAGKPLFIPNRADGFVIAAEVRAKTEGNSVPSFQIICSLEDFIIDLIAPLSFMRLHFEKLQFFASSGKKADVNVILSDIEFVGPLSFVETLKKLIPLDGFSDPPALSITENGIDASFSLSLPNIAVGMFSLQNMSLGAGFTIPFIGDPLSVRFNFCTRDEPFLLTVSLFGGGGFFGVVLTPAGIHILEASFEFGASISIDFGVASGGVHVMAGIYFKMVKEGGNDNCSLTGFFNLGGEVDVLGLISASLELELSLTYEFSSGKCVGKAVLTIEVHVLFFSVSVDIECERKFSGSKGDPSFEQLMGPYTDAGGTSVEPWLEYCHAFA